MNDRRSVAPREATRFSAGALRERLRFVWSALKAGVPLLWSAVGLVMLLIGGSLLAAVLFALDTPLLAGLIVGIALLATLTEGAFRLRQRALAEVEQQGEQLEAFQLRAPRLSYGEAILPARSQPIHVFLPEMGGQPKSVGTGRVIRIPVSNERGAGEATQVHARLTFLPDDRDGSFSPRHAAQAEWATEHGTEVEITIPGNGRPYLLDVLLVKDGEYPHAFEWTTASRHAALRDYAIKTNRVEVDVEVMGSGPEATAPYLRDTLIVELEHGHMIRAAWRNAPPDQATNWVSWSKEAPWSWSG